MDPIDGKYQQLGGPTCFLGKQLSPIARCGDGSGHAGYYEHGVIYWHPQTGAYEVHGAILDLWRKLGGINGKLGYPTTDESATPDGVGRYNHFQHGSIYWTSKTGACELTGQIHSRWASLGWERSILGYPITGEQGTPDGAGLYNHFERGSIYWTGGIGAWEVHGTIRDKWSSLGWERSALGYPTSGESAIPDGIGRYNHFEHGSIYWTPKTGACELLGPIHDRWVELGWERSILGYPTTGQLTTADGSGSFNKFEHGSIYSHPNTGTNEVVGPIYDKWQSLGSEKGALGYPVVRPHAAADGVGRFSVFQHGAIFWHPNVGANEVLEPIAYSYKMLGWPDGFLRYPTTGTCTTPDGVGHFNHFQGGSIYSHPQAGTFEIHGAIRDKWASLGWEQSVLGYPTTDVNPTPDGVGQYNHFQHGSIYWHPLCGANEIHGAILEEWIKGGWEQGELGYPTSDESPSTDGVGRFNNFQHGSIYWSAEQGTHVMKGGGSPGSVSLILPLNFTLKYHWKSTTNTGWPGVLFTEGMVLPPEVPGCMRVGYWNQHVDYSGFGNSEDYRYCWRGFVFFENLPKLKSVEVLSGQFTLKSKNTVWWHGDTASNERVSAARYLNVLDAPFSGTFWNESHSWGSLPAFNETAGKASYRESVSGQPNGLLSIDLTDLVQDWMSGTSTAYGLQFMGADESFSGGTTECLWTDYTEPTLTIKYIGAT